MAKSLAFKSAVIIMPPKISWDQIQAIRKDHDKAYERWMPHINLLYPFLPDEGSNFEEAAEKITRAFKDVGPFKVTFDKNSFGNFGHGRGPCTLWLKPLAADDISQAGPRVDVPSHPGVMSVQNILEKVFPQCNHLSSRSGAGFQPHLTLGQFNKSKVQDVINQYSDTWASFDFDVTHIHLISRDGDVPFEIRHSIPLGGSKEVKQVMDNSLEFKSAVIIMPPKISWDQIQAIRRDHDKAYEQWMPHINLLYPFVPDEGSNFDEAAEKITTALKDVAPFKVTLDRKSFGNFGKGPCTLWLKPLALDDITRTAPSGDVPSHPGVMSVQNILEKIFPQCSKSGTGFQPHLTLGQFDKSKVQDVINQYSDTWASFDFDVTHIHLISRDGDVPFEIRHSIPLRGY